MSYTVLARRYRSSTFDEIIGQEHVARTLKRAIETGRIAHAFLFCGTRGTGKTSTARVLAKSLNCQNSPGPTIHPCGQCKSCQAIARGDDIDVVEIDAASNTGVDSVRDIIDNSQYTPAHSRFKIYIIDEVHMLSKSAFNALLKTLEEPPPHVKFILATTEPEKVLPTIQSRCQRYDFRNIPTRQIADHLADICRQEKIEADDAALLLVAKAGAGSMRDALSLLDRLLSLGEAKLSAEMIEQLLGLPRSQLIFDLAQAIAESDPKSALTRADAMLKSGLSQDVLLSTLVEHLRNLLILRVCGPDSSLVEVLGLSLKDLTCQSAAFDSVALTQDMALLEELRRQLRLLQGGRALLDATLVRLALADQFNSISNLLGGDTAGSTQKKKCDPGLTSPPPSQPVAGAPAMEPVEESESTSADELPAVGKVWEGERRSLSSMFAAKRSGQSTGPASPPARPAAEAVSPPSRPASDPVDPSDHAAVWRALLDRISEQGASWRGILEQGRLAGVADDQAIIRIAPNLETFIPRFQSNGKKELLCKLLSELLQHPVGIRFEVDDAPSAEPPPAAANQAGTPAHDPPRQAPRPIAAEPARLQLSEEERARIEADPLIAAVMRELGAKLVGVRAE